MTPMADYHPLIARAVTGLDKNTGENRRALYERARTALVNQLRSVEPALDESDITRERLALEEAIRKVEAEAVKRTRAGRSPKRPSRANVAYRIRACAASARRVAEAEGLGGAAAAANRSAHEVYEAVPGDHPPRTSDIGLPPAEPLFRAARDGAAAAARSALGADDGGARHCRTRADAADAAAVALSRKTRRSTRGRRALTAASSGSSCCCWCWRASPAAPTGSATPSWRWWRAIATRRRRRRSRARQPTPATKPKIADRIGPASGTTAPANAPAAAVAQKVVLYDEDPNDPKGKRYVGSAIWRTETVSPGPGLAPELAMRADVEIPERHMRMTWSLRRNTDKALPASHTIEIMFTLPADFPEGGIGNVPGVLMKQDEQARGVPLAGLAVKVTNGYFLIGLSAVDVDVQRNIQLLKERDWFDIPIVYTSGKRAILAMEKGTPGVRAFEEAFRAWGE